MTDVELKTHKGSDFILGEVREVVGNGVPVPGSRRMLVRVLQADTAAEKPRHRLENYLAHVHRNHNTETQGKRFILEVRSIAPNFKIMLCPHVIGEPLPTTSWQTPGKKLTVKWEDQQDELTFIPGKKECLIKVKQNKAPKPGAKPAVSSAG